TVKAGTLQAAATNTFAQNSAFTIASGATLALNNFNETIGSLAGAGTVTNGSANGRTLTTSPGNVMSFGGNTVLPYGNDAGATGGSTNQQTSDARGGGTTHQTSDTAQSRRRR